MILLASIFTKSSITADTAFRKDLTLQGCTKVCHAYRPAHYLIISSLPWKAGWVGAVSTSPSLRTFQDHQWRQDCQDHTPRPTATYFPNTTILISVHPTIITHVQMEARTRGPWLAPLELFSL